MTISLHADKAFEKIQHPFMLKKKKMEISGIQEAYLNIVKSHRKQVNCQHQIKYREI